MRTSTILAEGATYRRFGKAIFAVRSFTSDRPQPPVAAGLKNAGASQDWLGREAGDRRRSKQERPLDSQSVSCGEAAGGDAASGQGLPQAATSSSQSPAADKAKSIEGAERQSRTRLRQPVRPG